MMSVARSPHDSSLTVNQAATILSNMRNTHQARFLNSRPQSKALSNSVNRSKRPDDSMKETALTLLQFSKRFITSVHRHADVGVPIDKGVIPEKKVVHQSNAQRKHVPAKPVNAMEKQVALTMLDFARRPRHFTSERLAKQTQLPPKQVGEKSKTRNCGATPPVYTGRITKPSLNQLTGAGKTTGGFPCHACASVLSSRRALRKHLRGIHVEQRSKCPHCSQLLRRYNLLRHVRVKHDRKNRKHCHFCKFVAPNLVQLSRHFLEHGYFLCPYCFGKPFHSSKALYNHVALCRPQNRISKKRLY